MSDLTTADLDSKLAFWRLTPPRLWKLNIETKTQRS